jgi:hypothetical protein
VSPARAASTAAKRASPAAADAAADADDADAPAAPSLAARAHGVERRLLDTHGCSLKIFVSDAAESTIYTVPRNARAHDRLRND